MYVFVVDFCANLPENCPPHHSILSMPFASHYKLPAALICSLFVCFCALCLVVSFVLIVATTVLSVAWKVVARVISRWTPSRDWRGRPSSTYRRTRTCAPSTTATFFFLNVSFVSIIFFFVWFFFHFWQLTGNRVLCGRLRHTHWKVHISTHHTHL